MKRNVAVLESIRELNDLFFETGDISRDEYEQTKKMFPLPGEHTDRVTNNVDSVARHDAARMAEILSLSQKFLLPHRVFYGALS